MPTKALLQRASSNVIIVATFIRQISRSIMIYVSVVMPRWNPPLESLLHLQNVVTRRYDRMQCG
jgi:hypothetical protein